MWKPVSIDGDHLNRERKPVVCPHPGRELVAAIEAAEGGGRPVWIVGDAVVPRLERAATRQRRGGYGLSQPAEEHLRSRGQRDHLFYEEKGKRIPIQRDLYLALLLPADAEFVAFANGNERASSQAGFLIAAAYRDLLDLPLYVEHPTNRNLHSTDEDSVARLLGYKTKDTARQAVRKGRALWGRLAAWPWWPLAAGNHWPGLRDRLPRDWHAIPDIVANFDAWREPEAFLCEQRKIRRQVSQRDAA